MLATAILDSIQLNNILIQYNFLFIEEHKTDLVSLFLFKIVYTKFMYRK